MAELFGVTTDYLLKDEIEEAVYTDGSKETPNLNKLSMEEANRFLEIKKRCGRIVGTGTVLCMLSPIGICPGFERVLCEGDYSEEKIKVSNKEDIAMSVYCPIVSATYLGYSFFTGDWGRSWIIWSVAAILSPAIFAVFTYIGRK